MNLIEKAKQYAIKCHEETNHKYDGKPYQTHLEMVYNEALELCYLVPESDKESFLAAAWLHDVIEDCRQTYNDVKKETNEKVAELVYALTNEKGKNRDERANDKYYSDMKKVPNAVLLKLCDRIANFKYSCSTNSKMKNVYIKENQNFTNKIFDAQYTHAFNYLNLLMSTHASEVIGQTNAK